MEAHDGWRFVHVLLLAYWLGADVGVFYCAKLLLRPAYAPQTRAVLAKVLFFLDGFPRAAAILMLPVGLQLAADLGLSPVTGGWLAAAWLASLLWLLVATLAARRAGAAGPLLARLDLAIRAVLAAGLAILGLLSLARGGPLAPDWLALKVLLYALVLVCGLGIRATFRPFGPAFAALMTGGSTPEVERVLTRSVDRAVPWVLALWVLVALTAWFGISQPEF